MGEGTKDQEQAIIPMIAFDITPRDHAAKLADSSILSTISSQDTNIGVSVNCASLLPQGLTLANAAYSDTGGATMISPSASTLTPQPAPDGFLLGDPIIADDGKTVLFAIGNGHEEQSATYFIHLRLTFASSSVVITISIPCR